MYRSNHFEPQNVGQGLAVGKDIAKDVTAEQSSVQRPNQQMPFTSRVQSINTPHLPDPHSNSHLTRGLNQQQAETATPGTLHNQALSTPLTTRLEQERPFQTRSLQQSIEQSTLSSSAITDAPLKNELSSHKSETDEQISDLFTAMGRASQLSQSQLAARLQTTPALISALESGALNDLPEWEEIEPVISRYAEFMNIDDRPILRRMREQLTEHFLTNMTADTPLRLETLTPQMQTPPPLQSDQFQNGPSLMPSSDMSLKAFANGNLSNKQNGGDQFRHDVNTELNSTSQLNHQSLEDRFTALTSAVSNSQNSSHIIAQSHAQAQAHAQQLDTRAAIAGFNTSPQQMQGYVGQQQQTAHLAQQGTYSNPQFLNNGTQVNGQPVVTQKDVKSKTKNKWLRILGNFALVLILLIGFINWQPNRFWSGVDQLPKPISKSIYTLFEFVMPDPLASVYRMNWVHVADPRMRKADKLAVPAVRKLPRLDFSKLGSLNN